MRRSALALLLLTLVGVGVAAWAWPRGDDETQARLQRLADGVVDAGVPASPSPLDGRYVHGYRASEHQGIVTRRLVDVSGKSAAGAWAAGAVVSTADDVARFFSALLQGRLLPPKLLQAMRTANVEPRRYGLGLPIFQTPCGKAWGHTGNINGHVTAAWNTSDASRQVVMLGNAFPLSPDADATFRRTLESAFCFVR